MSIGIIQGMSKITDIVQPLSDFCIHTAELPPEIANNLQTGASAANNDCYLTIIRIDGSKASFGSMDETLRKANLGSLKVGDNVNLKRAVRFGGEIGGHVMSGHVMVVTRISRIKSGESNRTVRFELPKNPKPYILTKGSIGLDGYNLTMGEVSDSESCVHLIPETLERALFGSCKEGDLTNTETDPQTQAVVDTIMRVSAQKAV